MVRHQGRLGNGHRFMTADVLTLAGLDIAAERFVAEQEKGE